MHAMVALELLARFKIVIQYVTQFKKFTFRILIENLSSQHTIRHLGALAAAARGGGSKCSGHHPSTILCCSCVVVAGSA